MSFHGSRTAEQGANFSASDLLRVMRERRRLVLTVALCVIGATALVLMLLPTLYSASAVVMLDQRKNNVTDVSQVLSDLPTDPASLQNQIQILTSRDLAARVIGRLKLYDDPEFNPQMGSALATAFSTLLHPTKWFEPQGAAATATTRDAVIDAVLSHLSVTAIGLSTTFDVNFTSKDPQKAARIADGFVQAYVADQLDIKYAAAQKTSAWLANRVRLLAEQVQADESAVQLYKAEHNLNEASDGVSLVDQQLAAINGQIVLARSDLAEKQATYNHVTQLAQSGDAADVSQAVASPVIVALRQQEATLIQQESDLTSRYGPKHPKRIAVEQQLRDLQTKIAQEVTRIGGSMANDVAVSRAQVGSLEGSLAAAEKIAAKENMTKVKLKSLEANAVSTRSMYEAFVTRLRETQDQDAIQMPDARMISPAAVPIAPSSPKRMLIFVASIPAGILLGMLAALMAERFTVPMQTVRRFAPQRPVNPVADAPVLARVPNAASARAADGVIDWPQSEFSQSIATIMHRIANPQTGARPRVVSITSAVPEAGKTNIAMALARTASRAGWRVVVVDGDLAGATLPNAVGYARVTGGIIDTLSGKTPLSRSFVKDPRSNALMLCCAQPMQNSAAIVGSPVMAQLLNHLRQSADLVIIDSPPAGNDAQALARLSDAVLMVVRPQSTSTQTVSAALQKIGGRAGIVLAQ